METPSQLFIVPALNSFHMGAKKSQTETRERFDVANVEKPKLPSIFGILKSSKDTGRKVKVSEAKPTQCQASLPKKRIARESFINTIPLGIVPVCDAHIKRFREAETRQTATPPPEKTVTPRAPVKAKGIPSAAGRKARLPIPDTTIVSCKIAAQRPTTVKRVVPSPSRSKAVQQLLTPPATPPLVGDKLDKVVSQPMGHITRSKVIMFPKAEKPKVAPKAVTPKAQSAVKLSRVSARTSAGVTKPPTPAPRNGRESLVSPPAAPNPVTKLVRSVPLNKIAGRVSREVLKPSPMKAAIKAYTPARAMQKKEVPRRVEIKAERKTAKVEMEASEDACSRSSTEEVLATAEEPAAVQQEEPVAVEVQETQMIAKVIFQDFMETPATGAPSETVDSSERAEVQSPIEDTSVDRNRETEEATCSNANSNPDKVVSPLQAAHLPVMGELKHTLDRLRSETPVTRAPVVAQMKKEQATTIAQTLKVATRAKPQEEHRAEAPAQMIASAAGSGIQARIAAMYASAGVKAPQGPVPMVGARLCKFKLPELLETDKASKDARIQREVEALRNMNKVGTGGAALVKTRAFGGIEPHNAAAEAVPEGRVLSLHCQSIIERVRKERQQRSMT